MLSAGDVDFLDPGKTYYIYTIGIINALHRGLYAYLAAGRDKPVPDLAADMPEISDGRQDGDRQAAQAASCSPTPSTAR